MLPGIGVFGTGNVVKVLVPILKTNGFKVEALWGRSLSEAAQTAQELGVPFFTTKIDDVLLRKDVDLVFVMCSPNLHAQISVKALGIGKHVLCDKPAGLCQNEALKMVHAAQYYPSLISIVNHSLRFLPTFIYMKKEIEKGYIGDLTLIDIQVRMGSLLHEQYDWLCDDTMGGGTLTLVGSHVIDLIKHLTRKRALRVHAIVKTFTKKTEQICGIRHISSPDFCTFQLELEGGGLVTANLNNHLNGSFSQEILVCGTKGHLLAKGCELFGFCGNDEVLYSDKETLNVPSVSSLPVPYLKGLYKMIGALKEAFLPVEDKTGWVKGPVEDAASFEDGLYVQAVINAMKKSNLNRKWVKVDVIKEEPDPNPIITAAVRSTAISS
ncbi:hypothetical protein RUM44_011308 [Polyplax serrata]|uniref:Glucose-fructose oxidoreductase domain-containing protein 1 n=1 Tax=Polyplax serrata TaxID=468196 RepID=A0ABR1APY8_POLSC